MLERLIDDLFGMGIYNGNGLSNKFIAELMVLMIIIVVMQIIIDFCQGRWFK